MAVVGAEVGTVRGVGAVRGVTFFFIRPKYFRRWVDTTSTKMEVLPVKTIFTGLCVQASLPPSEKMIFSCLGKRFF